MMKYDISSFYKVLNAMDDIEYIENYISYNIALISAGLKPSITLNFSKVNNTRVFELWKDYGQQYLEQLNFSSINLRESEKSLIVLIYDSELLEKIITKDFNVKL
ncbi:MAG: DUF3793 family protein, partial [Clostridium sp.]